MHIRPATPSDATTLSQLLLDSALTVRETDFTDAGWLLLQETNTVEAVQARFESTNYFALICEIDNIAAGYFAMFDFEKIDHMFVLSKYRGRGVASNLWAQAQEVCTAAGKGDYYWVRSSSYAELIYQSFGFTPSRERESTSGISFRLMEKGSKPAV